MSRPTPADPASALARPTASAHGRSPFLLHGLLVTGAWTAVVLAALAWGWHQSRETSEQLALSSARLSFDKDMVYRRWAAEHGGVYVPATAATPPNPYLSHLPERDLTTPSGRRLTLLNPAYMTRQVHELGRAQYGHRGHITSLKPLRPANAPDPWEREALEAFASGSREVVALTDLDGQPFLRVMRPMVTEPGCLKCHAHQGYEVGDIRGGISVSAPMSPYLDQLASQRSRFALRYGALWFAGLLGIWGLTTRLRDAWAATDAARRRAAQEEEDAAAYARQQQKLEAIGTLASGAAHEINNPINVIMNFGQLVLDEEESTPTVREYAAHIVREAERVASIVRALSAFARGDQQAAAPISPGALVGTVVSLVRSTFRHDGITIETRIADDLPLVPCHSQQIQQVIMNLLANARDALNERYPEGSDDKRITAEVSGLELDGQAWVRTVIADQGGGIPPAVAGRVFEPFFTTKPKHKGTGLGLSVSYGLVRNHGGRLSFESEPGQGTRFCLELPVQPPRTTTPTPLPEPAPQGAAAPTNKDGLHA